MTSTFYTYLLHPSSVSRVAGLWVSGWEIREGLHHWKNISGDIGFRKTGLCYDYHCLNLSCELSFVLSFWFIVLGFMLTVRIWQGDGCTVGNWIVDFMQIVNILHILYRVWAILPHEFQLKEFRGYLSS